LEEIGPDKFNGLDRLTPDRFDSMVFRKTTNFMEALKKLYIRRFNRADSVKDKRISYWTRTPVKEKEFEKDKEAYQMTIASLVKTSRISSYH